MTKTVFFEDNFTNNESPKESGEWLKTERFNEIIFQEQRENVV